MSIDRNTGFFIAACLVIGAIASSAIAQSKHTKAAVSHDVRQLMQLMDKDNDGTVSKEEFMDFMSQTFDRLDVNHGGQLEREELRRLARPDWMTGRPSAPGPAH
jgi:hypothetical protein